MLFGEIHKYHSIISFCLEEATYYENLDLENIITPVDANKLEQILTERQYDPGKTQYLFEGFKSGFLLGYEGSWDVKMTSENLRFRIGTEVQLWNKVMKEVKAKRYMGPFDIIAYDDCFIQSPIGLVPKDNGVNTRLIFHLSHPHNASQAKC